MKHFELTINEQTGVRRRLETRLLVRSPGDGVYGVTYKWNAAGTQATLVSDAGVSETYTITGADGTTTRTQTWNYPSRNDCLSCHNGNAGYVLGVSTRQLNGSCTYPTTGVSDNQLRTWGHIGLFDAPPAELAIPTLTKLVSVSDSTATLETRVRSWLDANCSHCHRPGGVHANFDGRFDTPLTSQGIVDGAVNSDLGIANARVIAPGSLLRSLMHTRDNSLDPAIKMPPLAKNLVDTQAIAAMESWIASLVTSAEITLTAPTAGAMIVRSTATTVNAAITGSAVISSVDFLANGTVVGSDATAPFSIVWSPTVSGPTVLTALAHTNVGDVASPGVSLTILDAPLPPSVTLTSPSAGSSATAPATIALAAIASDSDATITQVEFLQDGVVVASDTSAPYQASVANLAAGTYSFAARATDSQGFSATSTPAIVVVEAPSVLHGLLGTYYDNQDLTGTSLTRLDPVVDFTWGDGAPIAGIDRETFSVRWQGTVRTLPTAAPGATEVYSFFTTSDDGVRLWINGVLVIDNWTNHGATVDTGTITLLGDHEYAVVMEFYDAVIDATARLEWSSPSVSRAIIPSQRLTPPSSTPPPPQPPTVAITSPASGASFIAPGAIAISAAASDTDGTITQVEFLQNGVVIATDASAPYATNVSGLAVGSYSFTARATDSQGLNATSAVVAVTVTAAPVPPTVALTSPANGATAIAPATVALSATASDSDGSVTQVEFIKDGVVIATDTTAPYAASVSGLTVGSYVFAARATDTQGLTTTTTGATLTVAAAPAPVPPTVALTAPTNGATATAPAAFPLTANASDSDGTITQVEFLQNGLVVANDTTTPYGASLTGLAAGTYALAARATDSQGLTTTSATVMVTVTA
ncbi:MAG TPA: Ig-like domain-containing protein, partial [Planctomycetota bacterium]|nr:Ig-like domain-containing protein [Planctomycetota bacterium]